MSIEELINYKNLSFSPIISFQTNVITEPNRGIFPYPNFWRGDSRCDKPIVLEREAGFYPRWNAQSNEKYKKPCIYPNHCFQTSSFTIYPCYPECLLRNRKNRAGYMNSAQIYIYR